VGTGRGIGWDELQGEVEIPQRRLHAGWVVAFENLGEIGQLPGDLLWEI
jgi:hypothetical protein